MWHRSSRPNSRDTGDRPFLLGSVWTCLLVTLNSTLRIHSVRTLGAGGAWLVTSTAVSLASLSLIQTPPPSFFMCFVHRRPSQCLKKQYRKCQDNLHHRASTTWWVRAAFVSRPKAYALLVVSAENITVSGAVAYFWIVLGQFVAIHHGAFWFTLVVVGPLKQMAFEFLLDRQRFNWVQY